MICHNKYLDDGRVINTRLSGTSNVVAAGTATLRDTDGSLVSFGGSSDNAAIAFSSTAISYHISYAHNE